MQFYPVTYDGSKIVHGSETMTYSRLVDLFNDPNYFLYATANGLTLIPAFDPSIESDPVFEFTSSWIENGDVTISRLIINSNNEVKYEDCLLQKKIWRCSNIWF